MLKANEIKAMYLKSVMNYSKFYFKTRREKAMARLQIMVDRNLMTEEEKFVWPVRMQEQWSMLADILQRDMHEDLVSYVNSGKLKNFKISA